VQFDAGQVRQPNQRRGFGGDHVILLLLAERHRLDPLGRPLRGRFLEKRFAANPVRITHHRERPAFEVSKDRRRQLEVILDQLRFNDVVVRVENLLQIRKFNLPLADLGNLRCARGHRELIAYERILSLPKDNVCSQHLIRRATLLLMSALESQPVTITVSGTQQVSGLLLAPAGARACYVLAHGAGAGMTHPFMAAVANGLAERGVATLRYQFPYMEQRSKRPDPPKVAHAAVRAAVSEASRLVADVTLFAGGKSFGGRMTSQAQALSPLPGVRGLVFLGFPLHPAGQPSTERAKHLFDVQIPMLFLQGTRDSLADLALVESLCKDLGARAALKVFQEADHSFHVPARTGRRDPDVLVELLDALARWVDGVIS
jgi:predicted alpha/beta-hydrolase family hydrolase